MKDAKTILILLTIFAIIEGLTFWYVSSSYYRQGRKDKETEILSLKSDTTTHPSKPVTFESRTTIGTSRVRRMTDVERNNLQSFIAGLSEALGGAVQENDSLRTLIAKKLSPFQLPGTDSTLAVSDAGDTLRLYYWTLADVVPLDRSASVLLTFLPFDFPVKEILSYVPIDLSVPWYHPYNWIALGILIGALIVSLFF